jgi:hypothetical protein
MILYRSVVVEAQNLLANAQYVGDGYAQVLTQDIEALQNALRENGVTPEEPKGVQDDSPHL